MISDFNYYIWASYRRKLLDKLQNNYKNYYEGVVLDIGGRDRGKFTKPKSEVEKWIFADIEEEHDPDIILDVMNMNKIKSDSIDIINAIELFEHVEKPEIGLKECYRILKKDGHMIISVPFLYPVHSDPYDIQRWTDYKWKKELTDIGFKIIEFEKMGFFFTVWAEMFKYLLKTLKLPFGLRHISYLFYPLFDLIRSLDNLNSVKKNKKLKHYTTGYFIIAKK